MRFQLYQAHFVNFCLQSYLTILPSNLDAPTSYFPYINKEKLTIIEKYFITQLQLSIFYKNKKTKLFSPVTVVGLENLLNLNLFIAQNCLGLEKSRCFLSQIQLQNTFEMDNNQAYEMEQQQMQGSALNQNKGMRKGSVDGQKKQEDQKSVFVQNVDYGTTVQELEHIFEDCGKIISFKPKGCAYIQFADFQGVYHALMLSGTKLRNRIIKVSPKRTNIRGMNTKGNMQKQLIFSKFLSTLAANRNK